MRNLRNSACAIRRICECLVVATESNHKPNTKMKINRTAESEASARKILAVLQGDADTTASRRDTVISLSEDGDLLFYDAVCGTDDSETVLIDRLEADSMGDGWESATPDDVMDWLETNCEA